MTKQTDNIFSAFFPASFTNAMPDFNWSPDFQPVQDIQKKNLETVSLAQEAIVKGFQDITKRQTEIISQLMQDQANLATELMNAGTPEQKISKQADLVKEIYERSIDNAQEISNTISATNEKVTQIVTDRIQQSLSDIDLPAFMKAA